MTGVVHDGRVAGEVVVDRACGFAIAVKPYGASGMSLICRIGCVSRSSKF